MKDTKGRKLRDSFYMALITVALFLVVDLLMGQLYPKVHVPTKYGWTVVPDRKSVRVVQDTEGNYRDAHSETFKYGFKRWSEEADQFRVWIIGDSFTKMGYVSNGEEWYSYIEDAFPDVTFFVFGAGGYGTLQQYMVMDDHFDEVRPDAIIWQFCATNDYSNNYFNLDRRFYPFNNHHARPYLEDGEIVYRVPVVLSELREISFAADQLLHVYDRKRTERVFEDVDEYRQKRKDERAALSVDEESAYRSDERQGVEVSKIIARKVRERVGDMPVYFFNACGEYTEDEQAVCEAGEFQCVDILDDYLAEIEASGVQVKVENDGHWNYAGNKYVGLRLAEYFKGLGVFPRKDHD